jgi:hypothetical protein
MNYIKNSLTYLPGIILALILYLLSEGINNVIGTELLGLKKKSYIDSYGRNYYWHNYGECIYSKTWF